MADSILRISSFPISFAIHSKEELVEYKGYALL